MSQKKKLTTLPCIVCGKVLEDIGSGEVNHPRCAVVFRSPGNYGSSEFDPMDGSQLAINVCDGCLIYSANQRRVMLMEPKNEVAYRKKAKTSYWDGKG